jgi:hypothetical protein
VIVPRVASGCNGTIALVIDRIREMPAAFWLFLLYAFVILAAIGISLPYVVSLAGTMPVSLPGVVIMALLAYTIFTVTVILQRKQVGRGLALGLTTLILPLLPFFAFGGLPGVAILLGVLALLLFRGLLGGRARAYLSEP